MTIQSLLAFEGIIELPIRTYAQLNCMKNRHSILKLLLYFSELGSLTLN